MDGQPVDRSVLMSLFEAARWAPSHFNCQNWRFIYTTRDSPKWNQYLDCLWKPNQMWAKDAGVLVVAMSKKTTSFMGKVSMLETHSFEAGSAWMSMALEATARRNLVIHAMGGFEREQIAEVIGLPKNYKDEYQIEVMIAIGNRIKDKDRGLVSGLKDKLTYRNEIEKFISEDTFKEKL